MLNKYQTIGILIQPNQTVLGVLSWTFSLPFKSSNFRSTSLPACVGFPISLATIYPPIPKNIKTIRATAFHAHVLFFISKPLHLFYLHIIIYFLNFLN